MSYYCGQTRATLWRQVARCNRCPRSRTPTREKAQSAPFPSLPVRVRVCSHAAASFFRPWRLTPRASVQGEFAAMRAATIALLFAALTFSQAHQGSADTALHGLAASSRAAVAAATRSRAPLFLPHEASFLVVQSSGHARRLLDASDQSGDAIPSCAAELPCVQKLLALQQNQSALAAITNASNCPMQPADADKCFYVRALRCACARCLPCAWRPDVARAHVPTASGRQAQVMACSNSSSASPGFSGSSCGKNRSHSFGALGNSGFNATPAFSFSGPCGGFFNASGAPREASDDGNAPGTPSGDAPSGHQRSSGNVGHEDGFGGNSSCPPPFNILSTTTAPAA